MKNRLYRAREVADNFNAAFSKTFSEGDFRIENQRAIVRRS